MFIIDVLNAPGTTRTCDPLIRSQVLYPAELRVRKANNKTTNLASLCQVKATDLFGKIAGAGSRN